MSALLVGDRDPRNPPPRKIIPKQTIAPRAPRAGTNGASGLRENIVDNAEPEQPSTTKWLLSGLLLGNN